MGAMLPSGIFRSRWMALLWAGGILWTAYDVASSQPKHAQRAKDPAAAAAAASAGTDAMGMPVNADDVAALANAM